MMVSFSGGKSSAYMAKRLKDEYSEVWNMVFIFANTGQEKEETLVFIDKCSREWNMDIVWVEAVVHHGKKKGSTHRVVDFNTASRNGEPFEDMIKKYGIPNHAYPHCTRELKLNPMLSYMRSIGWTDYLRAVGIRSDEPERIRIDADAKRIIYPMVELFPTTKPDINDWWKQQNFNLELMDHQGNCSWCWKKSIAKHIRIAKENPEVFDFPKKMENMYGLNGSNTDGRKRSFFRSHRTTIDILEIANLSTSIPPIEDEDVYSGCSESCEAYV